MSPFSRRKFLKGSLGMLALACGLQKEKPPEQGTEQKKEFAKTLTKEKYGEGTDLNALHGEVANFFNKEVGAFLKETKSYRVKEVHMEVKKKGERFTMHMDAELILCTQNEHPQTIFELRSTVWTGKNALFSAQAAYKEKIIPWKERMHATYPDVVFIEKKVSGGDRTLAWEGLILSGGVK